MKGAAFVSTPKNSFSLTGAYDLPIPEDWGRLTLSGTYFYKGGVHTSPINTGVPEDVLPSYDLVNMRLDWRDFSGMKGLGLALFVDNLTKKEYTTGGYSAVLKTNGFAPYLYGAPRMYGAQLRFEF